MLLSYFLHIHSAHARLQNHLSSEVPGQEVNLRLGRGELEFARARGVVPVLDVDTLGAVDGLLLREATQSAQQCRLAPLTVPDEEQLYGPVWY